MIKKTVGWLMIAAVFAGLFAVGVVQGGLETTIKAFGISLGIIIMIAAGVFLATGE